MDKSLERARKAELDVQEIVDDIFSECGDIVDYINKQKEQVCRGGIEYGFVAMLIRLFLSYISDEQYDDELFKQAELFLKMIRNCIIGEADDVWRCRDKESQKIFFHLCYFIKQSIFNCINIGYPGGISYLEFVEDILRKNGISSSEQQREKLSDSFKKYISNLYNSKEDYIRIILSERMTHESVSDKNKSTDNDKYEFGPILLYERIAYEFEFFMKKRNQTEGMQVIMEEIDRVARERIDTIRNCCLPESFRDRQNRYSKLAKKPIAKMTDGELKEYIEYIKLKRYYIRKYAKRSKESSEYIYIEEAKLFDDLLFWEHEKQIYGIQINFDIIGRALWTIIQECSENERETRLFWDALINFSSIIGSLMDIYEKDKTIYTPMIDRLEDNDLLKQYKENWSKIPVLSIRKSEKKLQDTFVKDLQQKILD